MVAMARPLRLLLVSLVAFVPTVASAQSTPTWVVMPGSDSFSRAGLGSAYVEAFSHPDTMTQLETGIFVACDPSSTDGYDVFVWIGAHPMPGKDAVAGTVEVVTRRSAEGVRATTWLLDEGDTTIRALGPARAGMLEDLRFGGTLSLRVQSDPGVGAEQPTFEFAIDGFAAVEASLGCAQIGALSAGIEDEASSSTLEVHPLTRLLTAEARLADYTLLPEPARVQRLVVSDAGLVRLLDEPLAGLARAIGYRCSPEGADNGLLVSIVSPKITAGQVVFLVLFDQGVEIGFVEAEAAAYDGEYGEAIVVWDEDEEGLYLALLLYGDVDAVLVDADDQVLDAWRISARGFATAVNALPCR
jgi:hypothetical protein